MVNTSLIYSFGQTVFDTKKPKKLEAKVQIKDPEEDQIIEGFEGDCEQCEQEKRKIPCSICEE